MEQLVVFDLDGTLANTDAVEAAPLGAYVSRSPWQLLRPGLDRNGFIEDFRDLAFGQDVSKTPARLIERGYLVAIVTTSPEPYASTLLHVLGLECDVLRSSCGITESKGEVIREICDSLAVDPSRAVLVGDQAADRRAAAAAGVRFIEARELHSGDLESSLGMTASPWTGLLQSEEDQLETLKRLVDVGELDRSAIGSLATVMKTCVREIQNLAADATMTSRNRLIGALDEFCSLSLEEELNDFACAVLVGALLACPSLPNRRQLQERLFRDIKSSRDRFLYRCSGGLFTLQPRIVTQRELEESPDLLDLYLGALSRFGSPRNGSVEVPLRAVVWYRDRQIGDVLQGTKDYRRHFWQPDRFRSGPNVLLGRLGFVSDLVAAQALARPSVPLVPIPASPATERQPGQVSLRMARMVADRTRRPLLPLVKRDGDRFLCDEEVFGSQLDCAVVDLIDDQTTRGTSARECISLLGERGISVEMVYTYSASHVLESVDEADDNILEECWLKLKMWAAN